MSYAIPSFESGDVMPLQFLPGVHRDVAGPRDRVSEDNIIVLPDRVVLTVEGARWSTFTDTNSMDPVIDVGANAIQLEPQTADDIQVGDIISYASHIVDGHIIHRVVEVGEDEKGWYCRAKGDNNPRIDPQKIRFEDIHRVLIAIVY